MSALREDAPVALPPVEIPPGMRLDRDGKFRPIGTPFTKENRPTHSPGAGRPKGLARRIRDMVGDDPARVANVLFDILEDEKCRPSDRIAAAREILDRGWGKAPAFAPIEGGDPLEANELDKAIRDIADQLIARRASPTIDGHLRAREITEGVRAEPV